MLIDPAFSFVDLSINRRFKPTCAFLYAVMPKADSSSELSSSPPREKAKAAPKVAKVKAAAKVAPDKAAPKAAAATKVARIAPDKAAPKAAAAKAGQKDKKVASGEARLA